MGQEVRMYFTVRPGIAEDTSEMFRLWREMMVAHNNPASQGFWRAVGCTDYTDILWYDLEAE